MNVTLSQKGLILVVLPLLFQLAFVLVLFRFQREAVAAERLATHTKDVIAHTQEINTAIADAYAAVRGFVITREPGFVEPFQKAVKDFPDLFDGLDRRVDDNPAQSALARSVRSAAAGVLDWQGGVEERVRNGDIDGAIARVRSGRGKALMDEFRREAGNFLVEEDRLNRNRMADLERTRYHLDILFVAGGIAAVASSLALAYGFRRGIARRVAALEDNARRLAAGERLPPPPRGTDEIARLDRAFRDMAAELTESSDQIRDLYDHAPCGYHSVDPDGTFVAINRTELKWLGYERDEVIGRLRFGELVSPSSQAAYRATFERVKKSGSANDVEIELLRRDGTAFPVLLNSSAMRDESGRFLRSRTILTDLSERKRAEDALRLFADVARNIPIGLLIYQLDGADGSSVLRVRSGNRGASRLLGIPLEEASGRAVADVFPAIPEDQIRRYAAVAELGRPDDFGEFQYGDARVAARWWAVQAFPLPDRSVGIAFQDVSDRKRAETEVRRLNAELEGRVRERTAELAEANRDLVNKNAENEMFVYSVSHDLRSPLVNLQGFSREIEKSCHQIAAVFDDGAVSPEIRTRGRAILDGKVAKSIGFIQSAVLRLGGIIDAMLRLSRAGRVEYRLEAIDVGQLIDRVVGAAQGTIDERGAAIRTGELPAAWGDRTAIEQVFGNLIVNALTYLDPARPGIIEVGSVADSPEYRTYFVRDNGLGIAEGHRQKIFQAFQRAHPGIGTGEGLGLAIVARVVQRHRGRVWVESCAGEGSTFFVALPTPAE